MDKQLLKTIESDVGINASSNMFRMHADAIKEKCPEITFPELINSQINTMIHFLGNAIGNLRDICASAGYPQEDTDKIVDFIADTLKANLK
jgi:hypothetical protein